MFSDCQFSVQNTFPTYIDELAFLAMEKHLRNLRAKKVIG